VNTIEQRIAKLDQSLEKRGFMRLEQIGRGSTTHVFRCHYEQSGEDLAVKAWSLDDPSADSEMMDKLFENFRVTGKGETPAHSVSVKAMSARKYYVLMKLMETNLFDFHQHYEMSPEVFESLMTRMLNSLHETHVKCKAIHANVKPTNILVDSEGKFKLSDSLYLPIQANQLIKNPQLLPTPDVDHDRVGDFTPDYPKAKYISPELVNNSFGPVGIWMDQFMIGFVLIEQLLGTEQFEALFRGVGQESNDVELGWLRWHGSTDELPSPYDILPDLPPATRELLHRMTRKKVDQRYSSIAAALASLHREPVSYHSQMESDEIESKLESMNQVLHETPESEPIGKRLPRKAESAQTNREISATNSHKKKLTVNRNSTTAGVYQTAGKVAISTGNPYDEIAPERFTPEWWQDQWQDPSVRKKSLLAGLLFIAIMFVGIGGGSSKKVSVKFTLAEGIADAVVMIEGERVTEFPHEMKFQPGKNILIEAHAENYEEKEGGRTYLVKEEPNQQFEIKLDPKKFKLKLEYPLAQNGATIKVNGDDHHDNYISGGIGEKFELAWNCPGYKPILKKITIDETKKMITSNFWGQPVPIDRQIRFQTDPPSVRWQLKNGSTIVGTSEKPVMLSPRKAYRLSLEAEGYQPEEFMIAENEIEPGLSEHKLAERKLTPSVIKGWIVVNTKPANATVDIRPVENTSDLMKKTEEGKYEATIGASYIVESSFKGQKKQTQVKVAAGENVVELTLDILDRWTNRVGMEFVYVGPPEKSFKLGGIQKQNRHLESNKASDKKTELSGWQLLDRSGSAPTALVRKTPLRSVELKNQVYFPEVEVTVSMSVYVGVHEITIGDWKRVMGDKPRFMTSTYPDNYPVLGISRKEAASFIKKLEEQEGMAGIYRLLTDAEYEYLMQQSNGGKQIAQFATGKHPIPVAVDALPPDNLGLCQLMGNAAELVEDYYDQNFYRDNQNLHNPVNHNVGPLGIARGNSYLTKPDDFHHQARFAINETPVRQMPVGFRLARVRTDNMKQDQFRQILADQPERTNQPMKNQVRLSMEKSSNITPLDEPLDAIGPGKAKQYAHPK
jgi:serine/threonine protein kinase/formylglycine-generating enzyme required for sulfatase activity